MAYRVAEGGKVVCFLYIVMVGTCISTFLIQAY